MLEVITQSGAVIHIDSDNATQVAMLPIAAAVFGGVVAQMEVDQ